MKKKISLLVAAVLLLSCVCISAAAEENTVSPRWVSILSVDDSIGFVDNTGYYSLGMDCISDVTKIVANAELYYKNTSGSWIKIATDWSYTVYSNELDFTETFGASVAGREYKIEFEATAYIGSSGETVTKTITATR